MRHEDGVVPHSGHPNLSPLQLPFFIPQKYTKIGLKIFFFFFFATKETIYLEYALPVQIRKL